MLSTVSLTAVLGPLHPGYQDVRDIVYSSPFPGMNQSLNDVTVPVFSPEGPESLFLTAPTGTLVFMRARLDYDEKLGIILIQEFVDYLSSPRRKAQ